VKKLGNYDLLTGGMLVQKDSKRQGFLSFCKNNFGFCLQINIYCVPLRENLKIKI
jgi:hypothetical protein